MDINLSYQKAKFYLENKKMSIAKLKMEHIYWKLVTILYWILCQNILMTSEDQI